jgi:hypothetical protein
MSEEQQAPPPSNTATADPGLPPVAPPSGKFIAQLFVVPGLIVGLIVVLLIGVNWLFGGSRTPEWYLKKLDSANPDVRWRAAADLSQVLPRDNQLASNVSFALELTLRLDRVARNNLDAEKDLQARWQRLTKEEEIQEVAKLQADRDFIIYMSGCVGKFIVPVAAPTLRAIAEGQYPIDSVVLASRRRQALFALANLGHRTGDFMQLSQQEKDRILSELEEASKRADVGGWAREAREFLVNLEKNTPTMMGIDQTLEKCALAEDPTLRGQLTPFCARFWRGTPEEQQRVVKVLLDLTRDQGKGEDDRERFDGVNPNPEQANLKEVYGRPGFLAQANAVMALAKLDGTQVDLGLLKELLDEKHLQAMIQVERPDGTKKPNQPKIQIIMLESLKAVAYMRENWPALDLSSLNPLVTALEKHQEEEIRTQAQLTSERLNAEQQ